MVVVDQCVGVGIDLELVDRVRPRPVEGGELVLAGEQGRRAAGLVDDVEDRGDAVAVRPGHGAARELVVPRDPVATIVGLDPPAGEHAGVVGQRDGLLDLGAGVERRGTLTEQPPEGAVRPEPVQGPGVEPVDRDRQDVAGGPRRLRSAAWSARPGAGRWRAVGLAAEALVVSATGARRRRDSLRAPAVGLASARRFRSRRAAAVAAHATAGEARRISRWRRLRGSPRRPPSAPRR